MKPKPTTPELLTTVQLAAKLGVSPRTIQNWSAANVIPKIKIGKVCRFDLARVKDALQSWDGEVCRHDAEAAIDRLVKERDDLQSKLSTVYQWIERHHQDGFTDSLSYWQNLEKIGDKYGDRIDDAERQRDAAREDAEKYFKAGFDAGIASCYDPTEPSDADAALTQYVTLQAKTKP